MRTTPLVCRPWRRMGTVAVSVSIVSVAHFVTPAGVHNWHWLHILLQKLFYLPILMASACFGLRERETALHSKRVQEYALLLARPFFW